MTRTFSSTPILEDGYEIYEYSFAGKDVLCVKHIGVDETTTSCADGDEDNDGTSAVPNKKTEAEKEECGRSTKAKERYRRRWRKTKRW